MRLFSDVGHSINVERAASARRRTFLNTLHVHLQVHAAGIQAAVESRRRSVCAGSVVTGHTCGRATMRGAAPGPADVSGRASEEYCHLRIGLSDNVRHTHAHTHTHTHTHICVRAGHTHAAGTPRARSRHPPRTQQAPSSHAAGTPLAYE